MANRLSLQQNLEALIGNNHVYYQPPETLKITYPCIVYKRQVGKTDYADDRTYNHTRSYEINYITRNPDDPLIDTILFSFSSIRLANRYCTGGLYHNVYVIYY